MVKKNINLHHYFKGSWSFTRSAIFHNHMPQKTEIKLTGNANFSTLSPLILLYVEILERNENKNPFQDAFQRRLFQIDASFPERGRVSYENGTHIHDLDLTHGYWCFVHYCGNDVYKGSYRLYDDMHFEARWDVLGPAKEYSLQTLYKR